MIQRNIIHQLQSWRDSAARKPLVLRGLRQVGKTSLLKQFGSLCFEDTAYFNFEANKGIADLFKGNIDPQRIVEALSILHGTSIQPGKTLLILDEVQECGQALNSLKYFCEELRELHIAAAGSLLGIALAGPSSFPVGKVDLLTMYPVSLKEFIAAQGDEMLVANLADITPQHSIPRPIFEKYSDHLTRYFITGGMPEAVATWVETKDLEKTESVLKNILTTYELDFAKHAPVKLISKIREIWHSIPNQLARENKKFTYTAVKTGARAREYEDALNWLKDAGLVYKILRITKPHLPIASYADSFAFKVYLADIGLLRMHSNLPASVFLDTHRLFTEFKGAMSENYVLTELIASGLDQPFYWTSKATAEIEFILQAGTQVVPVEVKSGTHVASKSMAEYRRRYEPATEIRISMKNIGVEKSLTALPLFMVSEIKSLIQPG